MLNNSQDNKEFNGKTITFYSYKGGVGRSMALVNIACLMSKNKKKVLLIDWDLEAPGLHSFFNNSIQNEELGLVDLITDVVDFVKTEDNNTEDKYISFLNENLGKYIINDLVVDDKIKIDIIKAGKFGDEYSPKLNDINWLDLYTKSPAFFRTFAQLLETKYDYILIDSRTGLADTSGVCTMLMPQILVLVFALNSQNINGVIDVAKQSIDYRFDSNDFRSLTVLPLPSRIDNENSTELSKWIKIYKEEFEKLFKESYFLDECNLENYFNLSKIPYKANYAYGENIPVVYESTENDLFISYHYNQFQKLIDDSTPIWDILSADVIETNNKKALNHFQKGVEFYYAKEYEKSCNEYEKSIDLMPENDATYNNWGNVIFELAKLKKDEGLYKNCFEKYKIAAELNQTNYSIFYNWGTAIFEFAKLKKDEGLYKDSFEKYKIAAELNQTGNEIFTNWGNAISDFAKWKKDEELYKNSFEKYKIAAELNQTKDSIFFNWGNAISDLAILKKDEELYKDSSEKFKKAAELNPTKDSIFFNWGNTISNLAILKKDEELYKDSFEKYKIAAELNPTNDAILLNWGNAIFKLAQLRNDEELYNNSFEKYIKAAELNPTDDDIFNNWGGAYFELAHLKNDEELYKNSFEKFKKATELNPTNDAIFYNWGTAILYLAKMKNDISLLDYSSEILKKGIELGGGSYNLACLYALKNDKENALATLNLCLSKNEIDFDEVINDEDWKNFYEDKDFIDLSHKYIRN